MSISSCLDFFYTNYISKLHESYQISSARYAENMSRKQAHTWCHASADYIENNAKNAASRLHRYFATDATRLWELRGSCFTALRRHFPGPWNFFVKGLGQLRRLMHRADAAYRSRGMIAIVRQVAHANWCARAPTSGWWMVCEHAAS
ncbi:MAG: hypothetical protein WB402_04070 [Sulfuricaulis sp.]